MAGDNEITPNTFNRLLASNRTLVADGAMGTTLFSLGLEGGGCPELLNADQPDLVEKVHRGFIDAGSDIILTNTFGANRLRLALHGLAERVPELNQAAVGIARRAVDQAGRSVAIAGSIGPTGELFEPLGALSHRRGVEVFAEQCQALAGAGADVLWIETLSSFEELAAACEAAAASDLPYVATLSFDTAGRTMMGITATALAEWAEKAGGLAAIGANCGIGPGDAVAAVYDISEVDPRRVTIAKANCGMPLYQTTGLTYPVGPDQMGDYVDLAVRSGARIIGACCGSTPDHIAAIREAVDNLQPGPRPAREEIEERLGAVTRTEPSRRPGRRRH